MKNAVNYDIIIKEMELNILDKFTEKQKAFQTLNGIIRHISDIGEKKELAEYREVASVKKWNKRIKRA